MRNVAEVYHVKRYSKRYSLTAGFDCSFLSSPFINLDGTVVYTQDVRMHFHQMAHAPLDGSIQFFGVNMAASTFCAAVFPAIALPDRIIIGGRIHVPEGQLL